MSPSHRAHTYWGNIVAVVRASHRGRWENGTCRDRNGWLRLKTCVPTGPGPKVAELLEAWLLEELSRRRINTWKEMIPWPEDERGENYPVAYYSRCHASY